MITDAIKQLFSIYNWLEDEQSKEIYLNKLNFLVTGNYEYMHKIISKYVPDMAALNEKAIPELMRYCHKIGILFYMEQEKMLEPTFIIL